MDSRRFDQLAAVVAQFASRRALLRGASVASAGLLLGMFGSGIIAEDAVAKKKKKKKHNKKDDKKRCKKKGCAQPDNPCQQAVCRGQKCQTENQSDGTACGDGQICVGGECLAECAPGAVCVGGETCCSDVCVDTETSFTNCGGCGAACDEDKADTCSCGDCFCGDADPCEGDLVCDGGQCVCPSGLKLCGNACIANANPCFTTVAPANLDGWLLFGEDDFSNNPALTQIVSGPGNPPGSGEGSVKLNPTAFGSFSENQTQAVLRTLQYAGTKVSDIDRLAYSIFVPATAGDPPTMQLAITGNFNSSQFASLVFIPGANGNSAPLDDTWVDYLPSDNGGWVATRDILDGGTCVICNSFGRPHEGACADAGVCAANPSKTWSQIQAAIPNAQLNGGNAGDGGFSFRIGRGDTGEGNVTRVIFNDVGYFFEED